MTHNYRLASNLETTGWNPNYDVNAVNEFGMTPSEVALQAGNLREFVQITTHPNFQAAKIGRVGLFMEICRRNSETRYSAIRQYIDCNFKFDTSVRAFVKLA